MPITDHRLIARRRLMIVLGAGALVVPINSLSQQQGRVWRVGFLAPIARPASLESHWYGAFVKAMRGFDWVEGRNLVIEWRFADGRYERLPGLAAELVRLNVDVIVAAATPSVRGAQQATTTIPIVMTTVADPVGLGFVKSLARPGGNITGLSNIVSDVSPKHLELLLNLLPKLSRVAVLLNPANQYHAPTLKILQTAAQNAGVKLLPFEARTLQEIEAAFPAMNRENAGAIIVVADGLFGQQSRQIAALASKYRLPSIATFRDEAEAGALISYGQNRVEIYRHAAVYVDKILKGAKPGELPVEQPTKLELVINRKTAKTMGLTVPQELLLRADAVIE